MTLFPLFANIKERDVLVVGGGVVAERKTISLLKAGARVTVGAPRVDPGLQALATTGEIRILNDRFKPEWLEEKWLVIAATNNRDTNRKIAALAASRRLFVNVVDDPELSSFQVPSIVDRSPVIIAISSSGSAPVLARRIRERIETLFDHSIGTLAELAQKHRQKIRRLRPDLARRREFYDWLLDGPVGGALRRQQPQLASTLLHAALDTPAQPPVGKVMLVGAGPGDPGLLTLKALRALNEADVILYDRLVSKEVLDLARRDADFICVGKSPGENHDATQENIHLLMAQHASAGRRVVRLKGGDAFIFGRGGEELEFLASRAIQYEVIPGITAAVACAAYTGIPLTHRDHAQSVTFATAHIRNDSEQLDPSLPQNRNQTLAFYMGVGQLEQLANRLMQTGHAADTPFALIENGTRVGQRTLTGELGGVAAQARQHGFSSPSLLLVGDVTALAPRLHWFGQIIETEPVSEPVPV